MDLTALFLDIALLGAQWVLYLLVLLSIVSLAVFIERLLWFRGRSHDAPKLRSALHELIGREPASLEAATRELVSQHRDAAGIAAAVSVAGLAAHDEGERAVAEAMNAEKARWRRLAEQRLILLGTLGNNVPFIGLFGTVLGVMRAFYDLKQTPGGGEGVVMAGISEALVATAIGLFVAIPAVIAYNYFGRRIKQLMLEADECAHLVMRLQYRRPGPTS